jgi:hypothetical protein
MTNHTIEAVVAGSRGFAVALLAPLTERIGTRPRIAADPAQALAHCSGPDGLVVVEFLGPDTLRAIEDLAHKGKGVRILVALADAHAAAEGPLRALGVDLARWSGTPAEVLAAVSRLLDPAKAAQAAGAPPPKGPPSSPFLPAGMATAQVPPRPPAGRAVPPPPAPAAREPASAPAPSVRQPAGGGQAAAAPRSPPWPAEVPGELEAADALRRALAGEPSALGAPLPGLDEVVAGLSEIERAVLAGAPQPVDPEPIERAAVMRVRVAAALATVPSSGSEVDAGTVSAFLAEIDALLSAVNALAAGAPPDVLPSLEAVRNALVREAIDFSEAAQRASQAGAPAELPAARRAPARRSQARLLSIETVPAKAPERRGAAKWIALVVVVAIAASYHGWNWYQRRAARAALGAGLPAGMIEIPAPPGAPRVIAPGRTDAVPDPAEIARFKAAEEAKGNVVRESDGMLFIAPAPRQKSPAPTAP